MLEFDFESSVGYWICTTSHSLRKALESELATVGTLTLRQWEVLACLACEEGMTQAEMADRLGIEPPTLAGVINRMEGAELLLRKTCTDDRRKNRIYPTQKAEAVWKQTTAICEKIRAQAISGIDAETLGVLKTVCDQIRRNLSDAGHPDSTVPCLDDPANSFQSSTEQRPADPEAVVH